MSFDLGALVFIAAVTALSAILSGLPQAWKGIRAAPSVGLSSGILRATEGIERHALRDGIVIAQVAMAVVLMTASGLLVRSYQQLRNTDPGFDPAALVAPIFWTVRATAAARNRAPITGPYSSSCRRSPASSPSAARRQSPPARSDRTSNGLSGPTTAHRTARSVPASHAS